MFVGGCWCVGVARIYLISCYIDGAVLQELFSDEGIGTMVVESMFYVLCVVIIEDVGGILYLLCSLEDVGVLVWRNRELLECEIARFVVLEYDRCIVGCVVLYLFSDEVVVELVCLVVCGVVCGGQCCV